MRIVFTGGGTGGHFYPIIAVAEEVRNIAREQKLVQPDLYYIGPEPFDERALFEVDITWKHCTAGKIRRYWSFKNIVDLFRTIGGTLHALGILFVLYPDVVFSKGGYASVPTVLAAAFLRIPIVIHESDSSPGRATRLAARFADKIGVAYADVAAAFPHKNVAHVGNPIRTALMTTDPARAPELLGIDPVLKTIFVLGGSQGAERINDTLVQALPLLLSEYQVIHQTGKKNIDAVRETAAVLIGQHPHKERYHPLDYLDTESMRAAAGVANLVISRAGSGSIFEIATWGLPAILIPIPEAWSHDQRTNAFTYARTGAASVIEEHNLTPHLLASEINRIMQDAELRTQMAARAKAFARPDAARTIAEALVETGLAHD